MRVDNRARVIGAAKDMSNLEKQSFLKRRELAAEMFGARQ
jgi:hypothetical protein